MDIKQTLIFGLLIFCSCKSQLDLADLDSIAEFTIDQILNKNIESLLEISDYDKGNDPIEKIINQTSYTGLENISRASTVKFIKYEIVNKTMRSKEEYYKVPHINYYFKIDGDYYQISGTLKYEDHEYYYSLLKASNLSYDCELWKKEDYIPQQLFLGHGYWFVSKDRRSFQSFNIRGKNNSQNNIDHLKFTLRLTDKSGNEIFKKTIIHNDNILPGDTFDVPIPDLINYFVGFEISKSTFDFNSEILSVKPTPLDGSCDLVKSLK